MTTTSTADSFGAARDPAGERRDPVVAVAEDVGAIPEGGHVRVNLARTVVLDLSVDAAGLAAVDARVRAEAAC